jgi:flagellar hook capping protein FlgD
MRNPRPGVVLVAALAIALRFLAATPAAAIDVRAELPVIVAAPGAIIDVAIELDQSLAGFGVESIQYRMPIDPAYISSVTPLTDGLVWNWNTPFINVTPTAVSVLAVGFDPITSSATRLHTLRMTIAPGAPLNTDMGLTLSIFKLNEGTPSAAPRLGLLKIRNQTVGVEESPGARLALDPAAPNPISSRARITFRLPGAAATTTMRLAIHAVDGRQVRLLEAGAREAGPHTAIWDARDDRGRRLPAGLYFCVLECNGQRLVRRVAVL